MEYITIYVMYKCGYLVIRMVLMQFSLTSHLSMIRSHEGQARVKVVDRNEPPA